MNFYRPFLLGITVLLGTGGSSSAHAEAGDFSKRWTSTEKVVTEGPGGTYEGRIYERWVFAGDTAYTVGNIVHFRYPRAALKGKPVNPSDVANQTRIALGIAEWQSMRRQGQSYVFEGEWKSAGRYVRVFLTESADSITYDIAMFRMAYADTVAFEAEVLLRQLSGSIQRPTSWLDGMTAMLDLAIPDANASPASIAKKGGAAAAAAGASPSGSGAGGGGPFTPFGITIPSTTPTGPFVFPSAIPCPTCLPGDATCASIASACMDQAKLPGYLEAIMARGEALGNKADENWKATNAQLKRSNDILRDFMNPRNAFLWAAAGAAGGAFGALVVNTAIDGLVAIGGEIYELITQEKEEARILARFKEAREMWEKMSGAAAELEKTIDALFRAREIVKSFRIPREQMIASFATFGALKQGELRVAQDRLDSALRAGDQACAMVHATEVGKIEELLKVVGALQGHVDDVENGDQQFCKILKTQMDKLRQAEGMLQRARSGILGGQDIWQKAWNAEHDQSIEEFERARKIAPKIKAEADAAALKRAEKARKDQDDIKDKWMRDCLTRHSPTFFGDIPFIGLGVREVNRGTCKKEFRDSKEGYAYARHISDISISKQGDPKESQRELAEATRKQDLLYMHNPTQSEELKSMNRWFDTVRDEQACLQDPEVCEKKEYNRTLLLSRFDSISRKADRIDGACSP